MEVLSCIFCGFMFLFAGLFLTATIVFAIKEFKIFK